MDREPTVPLGGHGGLHLVSRARGRGPRDFSSGLWSVILSNSVPSSPRSGVTLYATIQVLHRCWSSPLAAPPLFARRDNGSARVTLCIFNDFYFYFLVFVKAAFSNLGASPSCLPLSHCPSDSIPSSYLTRPSPLCTSFLP